MTKSFLLAAAALTLTSAIAFAQNAPVSQAKAKHVARHEKVMPAKALYDYAPANSNSYTSVPLIFGIAY
jgi:hypothetical protein